MIVQFQGNYGILNLVLKMIRVLILHCTGLVQHVEYLGDAGEHRQHDLDVAAVLGVHLPRLGQDLGAGGR